jgi:hypothetical protein
MLIDGTPEDSYCSHLLLLSSLIPSLATFDSDLRVQDYLVLTQVFVDGGSRKNISAVCEGFYIFIQFFWKKKWTRN